MQTTVLKLACQFALLNGLTLEKPTTIHVCPCALQVSLLMPMLAEPVEQHVQAPISLIITHLPVCSIAASSVLSGIRIPRLDMDSAWLFVPAKAMLLIKIKPANTKTLLHSPRLAHHRTSRIEFRANASSFALLAHTQTQLHATVRVFVEEALSLTLFCELAPVAALQTFTSIH